MKFNVDMFVFNPCVLVEKRSVTVQDHRSNRTFYEFAIEKVCSATARKLEHTIKCGKTIPDFTLITLDWV